MLSGPFGSPNDCARAVNRECPTHTYAYYTEDAEDASNHACACQTILGTVVRVRCMSNFDIILGPDLDRVFRRSIPPHSPVPSLHPTTLAEFTVTPILVGC